MHFSTVFAVAILTLSSSTLAAPIINPKLSAALANAPSVYRRDSSIPTVKPGSATAKKVKATGPGWGKLHFNLAGFSPRTFYNAG
ncbi:hypothetical protein TWF132_001286 [Orbilia oligospora]|nr:hypothetical protein TWF751_008988 [Orbilia oligospora]KAF3278103.1 hypothetical protein TWF132_001286 [Orbilia oligospora]